MKNKEMNKIGKDKFWKEKAETKNLKNGGVVASRSSRNLFLRDK